MDGQGGENSLTSNGFNILVHQSSQQALAAQLAQHTAHRAATHDGDGDEDMGDMGMAGMGCAQRNSPATTADSPT